MSIPPAPRGRRSQVLAMLHESPAPMTIATIANRLGVHVNTARFHLDALVNDGIVERVRAGSGGPGRPPLLFRSRPGMDPAGPRNYQLLARILAGSLATGTDPAAAALAAGRSWGERSVKPAGRASTTTARTAVRRLVGLLADIGFAPTARTSRDGAVIGLHHCPFLELIETQAQVICPLHLGLMQGAMTALEAPLTVERLDPLVQPDLCVAQLSHEQRRSRRGHGP